MRGTTTTRRRQVGITLFSGLVGSALLAMSMTGTLSAFTASITNDTNTTSLGNLSMKESSGSANCSSTSGAGGSATCSTINKYGGQTLAPGGSSTTTVNLQNTGSLTASSFTLTPGTCTQTGTGTATDLCTKVTVKVYTGTSATGTPIYDGAASAFTSALNLGTVAPSATKDYTFVVSTPNTLGNTYQNAGISQPLTWTFTS